MCLRACKRARGHVFFLSQPAAAQAIILVVDKDVSLTITGMGDVIEPPDGIIGMCGARGAHVRA